MRKRRGSACVGRMAASLLGLAALTGCLSREALYRDVGRARDDAYEAWLRTRESDVAPQPDEPLTLKGAIHLALLYNKALQAAIQERAVARGELVSAYRQALPRVDASAASTLGSTDADEAALELRQPLFRGGGATAGLRAARLYAFWSDERVRDTVQKVIQQVIGDYYDALLADNLCQVNRDAVTSAEAHLSDVRVKRANGVASKYEELRAQVDVANFRAELIRQNNKLVLAKTSLLRTLGTENNGHFILADKLTYTPLAVSVEEAVKAAYHNRPDLYMAELNIRLQKEKVRAVRGTYLPEMDLVLSLSSDRTRSDENTWHGESLAGVELSWPLFDGFGREGDLIAERARLKQREIELEDAQQGVFLDVQQALLNLKNADENVQSQQLNLTHAEEGLRLAMTGYREGVKTEVEVVDARSSLTKARGNYYQALYDHCVARLSLERAMGVLGNGQTLPRELAGATLPRDTEGRLLRAVETRVIGKEPDSRTEGEE